MDAENLFICDTSFTVNWLLQSLRENDKEFQKLHGSKNVKNVIHFLFSSNACEISDSCY